MSRSVKKAWNVISSILVGLVVLMALLMVGARLVGLQVYTVLSGSMEPTYHTGSLIYVKTVDPYTIEEGQVITFMLNEDTIATHRVVGIVPDEDDPTVIRFRTKGDANEAEDGTLVHYKNVIGTPVFTIPYLGYVANYIQQPPGMYVAISAGAILLFLVFLPDVFADDGKNKDKGKDDKQDEKKKDRKRRTAKKPVPVPVESIPDDEYQDERDAEYEDDELTEDIRRKTHNLLTEAEVEALRRDILAGRFDREASQRLQQLLAQRSGE
jgi:signal peptidase I